MSDCKALALFGQHYWDVRGYNGFRVACLWCGVWLEPALIKEESQKDNETVSPLTEGEK